MPQSRKSEWPLILGLVLPLSLVAVTLSGCDEPQAAVKPAAPAPVEVGVVEIRPEPLTLTTELPGRTRAHLVAEVRPQVGGIIEQRLFREGAEVGAGELLYRIDPASFQAAYDSAKAALAKAQADIRSVQLKAERYKDLVRIKAVSDQDYDDARAALAQAQAEVEAQKAALETARINLDYTQVRAPIAGRIGRSSVTPGALVTADQTTALATIQQLDPVYVDVQRSSTEWLELQQALKSGRLSHPGADGSITVRLKLEDGSDYPQTGRLLFSEVTVDAGTGAITLRAEFPNPDQRLLPGMYVRAVLEEGIAQQALLVPQRAVSRDARGKASALVVNADGKAERRDLVTERAVGDRWLVTTGIAAGERVIVDNLQKVKAGALVKPLPWSAPKRETAGLRPLTDLDPI
ncbi:MAG TPA: efflux RND transporter periplasmic adaptor subunit [Plasticicumulans sp.]|uniref:efflux RND transporter periplasmic adaptor subunit n=1 Tax=Plasticicumulans sp. TaxID=2307179 RepID=UPI002BB548F3|nr:efflux RND transporter periplasmic adaptor subunit [Plasticicumulans sp.]HMW29954.1 efflux RND transporter periplasmic adaptor subunit [Plasticicumulans sp.]HMW41847.1 efflux RND transporter periplasmic adaptor subunit [Plasticicumulans sp.]HMZ10860.1 efflux RND transporter periplasmic adaptor subunit [Plasticicumulans sp.]HND97197.1 efflux RND transporter periplasmic adaptor subunit [Plasticicumulans sp.]HNG49165.1 efflux RND transporter periplasmic adaptor subunit [Plasticicumulans sp.]